MQRDFDLFVIGAGSGGVRAARIAAQLGAKVAIAEAQRFGGTCVNAGCIPKKLLVFASEFARHCNDARGFGVQAGVAGFDWPALLAAKDREVARLNQLYRAAVEGAGVEVLQGHARLAGPEHVELDGHSFRCRYVLIATGSSAIPPDIPGGQFAITSDQAFALPRFPQRVTIVGGGYVGLEFAGIFRGLGAEVRVVTRGEQILSDFDVELRVHLERELRQRGIEVRGDAPPAAIEREGDGLCVRLRDGTRLCSDQVLWAVGRRPNTHDLGLAAAGVACAADGAVRVDAFSRTTQPNVFAVGDCTGRQALTPLAIADGQAAAHTMFDAPRPAADRELVPTAVFSQPPVARVGLSEAEARARGLAVSVFRSTFTPLKHRVSGRATQSLVKLVVDAQSQRVLGCHMVGEDAPEIMQGFAVALQCGATKAQFDATIGIHPTAAEELVTLRVPVSASA
jgi:glutathione reductase (NADPH)